MDRRAFVGIFLVASLLLAGCSGKPPQAGPADPLEPTPRAFLSGDSVKEFTHVVSYDGHRVPITLYRPVEATAKDRVPVILHSHGWAGSRATADNAFRDYHRAGFGVLSIDMRGHGEARSTSVAQVHHMDHEIKDVREVISFVARLDWSAKRPADDPIVGAIGGSYGGGYQLLTAATDPRLDAIAPEITWNDLVHSLVPNGAIKSAWIDLLYAGGNANARLHPNIHQGFAKAQTMNRIPDGSLPGEYDLRSQFRHSSPASHPDTIRIPTLLIQGVNDTLFNLNEAVANYELIAANGAPVILRTHLGGHILNTRGTIPVPAPQPVGLQAPAAGSPCGNLRNLTIAFYQTHLLKRKVELGPNVCLALEDGGTIVHDSFPPPLQTNRTFPLPSVTVMQLVPRTSASLDVLHAPQEGIVLAGIPRLRGNVTTSGDAIVLFRLDAVRGDATRTLNAQVTPLRTANAGAVDLALGGVGAQLKPGETLRLTVSPFSDQFAHNGGRTQATTTFTDLRLELPMAQRA